MTDEHRIRELQRQARSWREITYLSLIVMGLGFLLFAVVLLVRG